ncbi:MAG: tyrosine-type recombinase/integrase [Mesoflavibacter sp.]|nr:tyrosine-type recombinase/integrase [Mesoflavibacter sp.]
MKTKKNETQETRFSRTAEAKLALKNFRQRMVIANRSPQSIQSYLRSVESLIDFHQSIPDNLDIDQVIDFLHYLKEEKELNWRTLKVYVAGLRWYYKEMLQDEDISSQIPYPKEEKSLPEVLSREELTRIFNACLNDKHKVMFRLMYSSGLRRNELINLKPQDIETRDGKSRIRIRAGKGKKDRYTVLSKKVLEELRLYFISYHPKIYLFNGRRKGEPMSRGGLRHALKAAVKRTGMSKPVNMHILRHCFASHAIEEGINIKTLQYLLGHSSVQTTLVYLHISEVPLEKAFSPIDKWEK